MFLFRFLALIHNLCRSCMFFTPVAMLAEEWEQPPEHMPLEPGHDSRPGALLASSWLAILMMINGLEPHVAKVSSYLIGTNPSTGQFRMKQFNTFVVHLIPQDRHAIEQFERGHRLNPFLSRRWTKGEGHGLLLSS
jgi:hypothetical protein